MRDYEVTVIYDLALAESEGRDAPVQRLTAMVRNHGGEVTAVDHWGRRRLAYPIRHKIDGDYVVARVRLDPANVRPLEHSLRIDEQVYRFLVVRAEELPPLTVKGAAPAAQPAAAPAAAEASPSAGAPEPASETPAADEEPSAHLEGDDSGEALEESEESGPEGEDPNP